MYTELELKDHVSMKLEGIDKVSANRVSNFSQTERRMTTRDGDWFTLIELRFLEYGKPRLIELYTYD